MEAPDLSHHSHIATLSKLTVELRQSRSPLETLRAVRRVIGEAYGLTGMLLLSTRDLPQGQFRIVQMEVEEDLSSDAPTAIGDPALVAGGPVQSGGVIGGIVSSGQPQLMQDVDFSADPVFADALSAYGSLMAVPFAGNFIAVTWVILLKRPPERFTEEQLEEAMLRVALVGSLLDSQTMAEKLARANEQIDRDAQRVGQLQRSLLPASVPRVSGLEIAVHYEPSGTAGGDFYDFFRLEDGDGAVGEEETGGEVAGGDPSGLLNRWCIFIGDAAGHGLAAAVVMAILQSVLHSHPAGLSGPAELMAHANRQLCRKNIGGFVTAFLAIYDPASGLLRYCAGGHPPPLLKRCARGTITPLNAEVSYPLGIDVTEVFKEASVPLSKGDMILLYTDGITEARNPERELFGIDRLTEAFRGKHCKPSDLIERLTQTVKAYEQGRPPTDDQTMVAVRVGIG